MAELINKNNICFRCSYGGECMAEIEDCKICVHYVCDYEDIQNVDVVTEQETRNKTIDEFVERLKTKYGCLGYIDEISFKEIDEIAEEMRGAE